MDQHTPVDIFWFSGTGNTLIIAAAARDRLQELGYTARLLPLEKAAPEDFTPGHTLGIIIPVAGQGTYPLIWDFLKSLPKGREEAVFLIDTLGIYSGGIVGPVKRIVRRKGYRPEGAIEIRMPNNFYRKSLDPGGDGEKIGKGKAEVSGFIDTLAGGTASWRDIPVYSDGMSLFFRYWKFLKPYRLFFRYHIDPEACSGCLRCVSLCPAGNLAKGEPGGVPVVGDRCMFCHRCVAFCPEGAIRIGPPSNIPYRAMDYGEFKAYLEDKDGVS